MKARFIIFTLTIFFILLNSVYSMAQCAMCRATVEKNVSEGEQLSIAANLNLGIMYLFLMPYAIIIVIWYFWRKKSKQAKLEREALKN